MGGPHRLPVPPSFVHTSLSFVYSGKRGLPFKSGAASIDTFRLDRSMTTKQVTVQLGQGYLDGLQIIAPYPRDRYGSTIYTTYS